MSQVQTRSFTVDEYYRMAEAGILHEDDRVELIRGAIVEMSPIGSRHAGCVDGLSTQFHARLSGRAIIRVQGPVRLSSSSEPQPDVMLLRPRSDFYRTSHPGPADVLLIVEVSDSSLEYDRGEKLSLYAEAGIPEVWIVDLEHERVEVYREPEAGRYRRQATFEKAAAMAPQAFPDVAIGADVILGWA